MRDLPTEVALDERHGLERESVVNCDNLLTVPKASLVRWRGRLGVDGLDALEQAVSVALELD